MNSLSWLLYAADVTQNIQFLLCLAGIIGGAAVGMAWMHHHIDLEKPFKAGPKLLALCLGSLLVSAAIPDDETFYAIAVSEVGEEVVKSETAGKAVQALNNWLDAQLEEKK